jgi:hypothetical protein
MLRWQLRNGKLALPTPADARHTDDAAVAPPHLDLVSTIASPPAVKCVAT